MVPLGCRRAPRREGLVVPLGRCLVIWYSSWLSEEVFEILDFFFFKTQSHHATLTGLELTTQTRLVLNTQRSPLPSLGKIFDGFSG